MQEAAKIGVSLEGVEIIAPQEDARWEKYIDDLVEARKKKGLARDAAADLLMDGNYFATMMVRCGDADGLVSGAAHTTAATVRPAMQVGSRAAAIPHLVHRESSALCKLSARW